MFVHIMMFLHLHLVIRKSNGIGDVSSDWLTDYYKERERTSYIAYETASLLMTMSFSCKQARRFPYSQSNSLVFCPSRVRNSLL